MTGTDINTQTNSQIQYCIDLFNTKHRVYMGDNNKHLHSVQTYRSGLLYFILYNALGISKYFGKLIITLYAYFKYIVLLLLSWVEYATNKSKRI